ncbi:MAG TPA: sigma-70 family RNA polymerase sigma factor [Vicinamibacteria bacterium]|nr:sigma-70 family RNA polymerase sigma factor [Vicinamibacteria bacterium]
MSSVREEAEGRNLRAEFEDWALPVAPALYRTAHRLTRRPEDARDLVQETMLRAYRTFQNFQPGTNVRAWLFTILYSIVSNEWRRRQRAPEEVSMDVIEERFAKALRTPDIDAESALLQRIDASPEIDSALRGLPEDYRAAILLVDVEELSYEDAAGVLGCPVGTVRSRLHRARKLLFIALRDYARRIGVAEG